MNDITSVAFANAMKKGFEISNLDSLKKEVRRITNLINVRYHPNRRQPLEDIAWDCFTNLYTRGFFHKYDLTKAKKTTYLWNGVKNYLIDLERSSVTKLKPISLDVTVGKGDITLSDFVEEKLADKAIGIEMYLDVLSQIKNEGKLGVYKAKAKAKTTELGEVELSGYVVLYLSLVGYKTTEIAKKFKVNSTYVSMLYREGVSELKGCAADLDFEDQEITELVDVLDKKKPVSKNMPHCAHCGKEGRFWSDQTWSALPFYVCKSCGRAYSDFTGSPVGHTQNRIKLKFVGFCRDYMAGKNLGECARNNGLGFKKAHAWVDAFNSYFRAEPHGMIEHKLARWVRLIERAEQVKQKWKDEEIANRVKSGNTVPVA